MFTRENLHSELIVVWFPIRYRGATSNTWGAGEGGVLSVPQIGEFCHLAPYDPELRFRIDLTYPPWGWDRRFTQIGPGLISMDTKQVPVAQTRYHKENIKT